MLVILVASPSVMAPNVDIRTPLALNFTFPQRIVITWAVKIDDVAVGGVFENGTVPV